MKLKKIAALALAGVMAVSMLAGCAGKGTDDKTDMSKLGAAVVSELAKATTDKVTFTSNSELADAVTALKAKYGTNFDMSKLSAKYLSGVSDSYTTTEQLVVSVVDPSGLGLDGSNSVDLDSKDVSAAQIKAATKSQTATYMIDCSGVKGYTNTDAVAKALAAKIDSKVAADKTLVANSGKYKAASGYEARVDYTYTGTVSVYAETDAETGVASYYAVYTVTRTGSEVKSNLD